ncbi:GTP-binding protein drn-1-like [Clytia hemisphaerica]|uniref:Uncharacterized protein n=1 Tax=Clytia hemisphaerica TaxID=252671 RepID=A0A7M5VEU0_9CNID
MRKKSFREEFVKVAFMGPGASGKTCIVHRLVGKKFSEEYEPTVFDFYDYESKVDNTCRLSLQISDTAGAFSFPAMDRLTIQKSDVVVVVFDLTSMGSLKQAMKLAKEIRGDNPKKAVLVIGNKSDLALRVAAKKELENTITCNLQMGYCELSAKYDDVSADLIPRIAEEFAISKGPYDVKRSRKPLSAKFKRKLSKSTENLLDLF